MALPIAVRAILAAGVASLTLAPAASASFSLVSSPNSFGNNVLGGVSASSGTDAWAVGTMANARRHSDIGTLTEHWDGLTWSVVPSPDQDFFDDEFFAVSDVAPGNAWAVGLIKQAGFRTGNPLIAHWNGTSWQTVSPPSLTTGVLRAITADSPNDVWTVGDDTHGRSIGFHFDGSSWSVTILPALTGTNGLQGIKAFSPTNVWAVGANAGRTLVVHWDGSAWSVVPSPNPDPNSNIFHAIDGTSSSDMWAVGQKGLDETSTGVPPGTRTLAAHWNGTTWKVASTPNTGDQDTLNGVAAIASSSVAAAGTYEDRTGTIPIDRTLGMRWNGTSWVPQVTPDVGATDNLLNAAARIPGATNAWAVGFHLTATGPYQTLIMRGGGG